MPLDNLNSRQRAQIVDLLCEGEIEGFPSAIHPDGVKISHNLVPEQYAIGALKDVFFNNTPVLNSAAEVSNSSKLSDANIKENLNFDVDKGVFQVELGTQDQPPLSAFGNSSNKSTVQVNTEVSKASVPAGTKNQTFFKSDGAPVTRSITDADVDQVNITVGVPALTRVKDNGTVKGTEFRYKIQIKYNGESSFADVPLEGSTDTIDNEGYLGDGNFQLEGYTPDLYQRTHVLPLDTKTTNAEGNIVNNTAKYPVEIRVIRTTQEVRSDNETIQDTFIWYNYVQVITDKTRYPNSVVFGFKFDAQQFPSIPKRTFRIRGLKIRIPHNATVRADGSLSYSGTFNGSFKAAREWTNDPAWILYDLLTSTRYGLGSYILTPEERKEAEDREGDQFEGTTDVASNLDVYSFQQASAYCGELIDIPDGTEPRFS